MTDTTDSPELLPCPFCGGGADVHYPREFLGCVAAECAAPKVHYDATVEGDGELAAAAWNRRADLARPAPVRVKPLTWWQPSKDNNYTHGAKTTFGTYYVHRCGGRCTAWLELIHEAGIEQWEGETRGILEQAMQDAQEHYEARILAALSPAPAPEWEGLAETLYDALRTAYLYHRDGEVRLLDSDLELIDAALAAYEGEKQDA